MSFHFVKYLTATGGITCSGCLPEESDIAAQTFGEGEAVLQTDGETSWLHYYIVDGVPVGKTPMTSTCSNLAPTEDMDEITITCEPGSRVLISGPVSSDLVCEDGLLEITFEIPGTYTVDITSAPHLPVYYTIEVQENES